MLECDSVYKDVNNTDAAGVPVKAELAAQQTAQQRRVQYMTSNCKSLASRSQRVMLQVCMHDKLSCYRLILDVATNMNVPTAHVVFNMHMAFVCRTRAILSTASVNAPRRSQMRCRQKRYIAQLSMMVHQ
jgi:hypothetical protein